MSILGILLAFLGLNGGEANPAFPIILKPYQAILASAAIVCGCQVTQKIQCLVNQIISSCLYASCFHQNFG